MFYEFLYPLYTKSVFFNVFKYITFRTFACLITAMLIYLAFGKPLIKWLKSKKIGQIIRDDGPKVHYTKTGTPTMGGALIIISILISTILWMDLSNARMWLSLGLLVALGGIGLVDDLLKFRKNSHKGLSGRVKFLLQILCAVTATIVTYRIIGLDTQLSFPFFKLFRPDLGWWYVALAVFIIVGASNAVNLTDGLDGLATVPSIMSFGTFAVLAYIAGHAKIASYLQVPYLAGTGDLSVFCGAVVGACMGFLWFNTHPAEIFMGDVGSLPLGGTLGLVALFTKNEFLLVIVGGIFVLEAVSVITQVISFQLTGKRIFRMAPIHHHFELKGWKESKVIVRFWIISFILALISLATLKLR